MTVFDSNDEEAFILSQVVPLELLTAGEQGRVCDVCGDQNLVSRLDEMGLRMGVDLKMLRPGKPCIVALENQRLSFRAEDNLLIMVEVLRV